MTLSRILATLAVSSALAGSAFAQVKGNITHFTPSIVLKALTDLGVADGATRKQQMGGGQSVDVVYFSNGGLKHVGVLTACNTKGCLGLQLMTIWGDNAGKSVSRTALNQYNAEYVFGKGYIGSNNTLVFARYTIADGGVSMDNLKSNIGNFANGSAVFMQQMAKGSSGTEASLKPADEAVVHSVAQTFAPDIQAVLMEAGQGASMNTLAIQSTPVPDAPLLIKPAQ